MAHGLRTLRTALLLRGLGLLGTRRRRILGWRALAGTGMRDVTFARDGLVWTTSLDDEPVGLGLFADGHYQGHEIAALQAWMARAGVLAASRDVVVDVGAHIGSTCIPMVRATGCRALAIEPVAESFRRLTANVTANGLDGSILLARAAVQRVPGRITMRVVDGASGSSFVGRGGAVRRAAGDEPVLEEVDASPLTAIVEAAGLRAEEIALVWADVQGCEAEVIASGARLWAMGVPLWAEIEPTSLARQESLATFVELAGAHFDRFIAARDLVRLGAAARPSPIGDLRALISGITPEQLNTDALFLPPQLED